MEEGPEEPTAPAEAVEVGSVSGREDGPLPEEKEEVPSDNRDEDEVVLPILRPLLKAFEWVSNNSVQFHL
jgi:hypothetical protein